mmetsp:Transcript_13014/g.14650  ORF Transcript_13014/g.14650 Transcript_13014/m.14650 type:complete len:103 (+) Transcript_13014:52-360(+)|eukprot:CAMPEP_0205832396 /NCGR_PEP_ID=MMETSP0206-20130828/46849_1 /ASSEMBLY_ACC=CAM_ASM_000279 /TAXON_ID=36767 /ORGANISM="Euplotes focardii, Strain TN1" /LENGTH=102 /DNA_ID=CAMNT_0053137895 /DNA_START=53 /DNA_END=361 /DNA_ORIENTATION=+
MASLFRRGTHNVFREHPLVLTSKAPLTSFWPGIQYGFAAFVVYAAVDLAAGHGHAEHGHDAHGGHDEHGHGHHEPVYVKQSGAKYKWGRPGLAPVRVGEDED